MPEKLTVQGYRRSLGDDFQRREREVKGETGREVKERKKRS